MDSSEQKLSRIADRIISDIGKQYMTHVMSQDKRMRQLTADRAKAVREDQFLKVAIISRQMEARTRELMTQETERRIREYISNGRIDSFLDEEDHEKIEEGNAMTHILLDALDSVLNDIAATYDGCGFGVVELKMQKHLADFRKTINDWFDRCSVHGSEYEEDVRSEGDKMYDYCRQRQAVMRRKIERKELKRIKEEENGQHT